MILFKLVDDWSIAESKSNDCLMVIRFRNKLDSILGQELYPDLLQLSWEFPQHSQEKKLAQIEASIFEDLLVDSIEHDLQSILAFVTTDDDFKSWFVYTNDVNEFSHRLHNIAQREERYPIEISLTSNEGWKSYNDIMTIYNEV
jgi:Family of unknown function (DUF695)